MNRSMFNLVVLAGLLVGAAPFVVRAQTATPAKSSGAIEGAVYNDGNGNDVFDLDESGVQGITLRLKGDGIERTAKTDEGGLYRFVGVPNGTYTVTVDPGEDYTASDRTDYEGLDVSGDTLASVDFALRPDSAAAGATTAAEPSAIAPATNTTAATAEPSATAEATVEVAAVVEPEATVAAGMVPPGMSAMATAMAMYPTPDAAMQTQPMPGMATAMPGMATAMPMVQPGQMVISQPAVTAEQMPQTGFEDLGGGTLLGAAVVVLMLLAGAGWAMERRG